MEGGEREGEERIERCTNGLQKASKRIKGKERMIDREKTDTDR